MSMKKLVSLLSAISVSIFSSICLSQELDQAADALKSGVILQGAKVGNATLESTRDKDSTQGVNVVTGSQDTYLIGQGTIVDDDVRLDMKRGENTVQGVNVVRAHGQATLGTVQILKAEGFTAKSEDGTKNVQGGNVYMSE